LYIELGVPSVVCPISLVSWGNALAKQVLRLMSVLLLAHVDTIELSCVLRRF
jgi:hypothetical protein